MSGDRPRRPGAALVIGIGAYRHDDAVAPLRYAADDARAVAAVLADPDVGNIPPERVLLLIDDVATRAELARRLSTWLPEQTRGQEIAVVYFAGHGLVGPTPAGEEGYLVAHDSDPERLADTAIAMSDLTAWLKKTDASAVVLCLDCCHAGKAIVRHGVARRGADASPSFSNRMLRPAQLQRLGGQGRFLLASCNEGESSLEADDLCHGLFTYHLLRGLEGQADRDGDGKVGVAELFEFVAAHVERDARERYRLEQRPWHEARGPGGVYLTTPRPRDPLFAIADLEAIWREDGAAAAATEAERQLTGADTTTLLHLLRFLKKCADPAGVPAIFRCLTHTDAAVREQAKKALDVLGWDRAAAAIKGAARRGDPERVALYLDGLAGFEAHRDLVALLDELMTLLRDEPRARAFRLLERKRLGLELERTKSLFEEIRSPYQIQKVLGQGLFASAYLACDETTGLEVVVRVLRPEFVLQPALRAAFLDLGGTSVRYVHQNLVLTREVRAFPEHGLYWVVRDYVEGATLQRVLESGKRFDLSQAFKLIRYLLDGLRPIHARGRAHCGVKPSNIFVGTDDLVVLGDLSLSPAEAPGAPRERLAYDFRYVAPEVFSGASVGPPADLYAVGCLLHELLCGRPPFVADQPFELVSMHQRDAVPHPSILETRVSKALGDVLLRMLAKNPQQRPSCLDDILKSLEAAMAPPPSSPAVPQRPEVAAPKPLLRPQSLDDVRLETMMPFAAPPKPVIPVEPERNAAKADVPLILPEPPRPVEPLPSRTPESSAFDSPFSRPTVPRVGDTIGGYQLTALLGEGTFGWVFAAENERGINFAIKIIKPLSSGGTAAMSESERRALEDLKHVQHTYLLKTFDYFWEGTMLVIVMEKAKCTLHDLIRPPRGSEEEETYDKADKTKGIPVPVDDLLSYMAEAAAALDYLHSQTPRIIHRDVKPANILLMDDGHVRVADFSLAKALPQSVHSMKASRAQGSPAYMAPECYSDENSRLHPQGDLFSLAVSYLELRLGHWPRDARSATRTNSKAMPLYLGFAGNLPDCEDIPREEKKVLLKALSPDAEKRHESCRAFVDDLRRAVDEDRRGGSGLRRIIGKLLGGGSQARPPNPSRKGPPTTMTQPKSDSVDTFPTEGVPTPSGEPLGTLRPVSDPDGSERHFQWDSLPFPTRMPTEEMPPPRPEGAPEQPPSHRDADAPTPPVRRRRFRIALVLALTIVLGAGVGSALRYHFDEDFQQQVREFWAKWKPFQPPTTPE